MRGKSRSNHSIHTPAAWSRPPRKLQCSAGRASWPPMGQDQDQLYSRVAIDFPIGPYSPARLLTGGHAARLSGRQDAGATWFAVSLMRFLEATMKVWFAVLLLSATAFSQSSKNPVTDVLRDSLAGRQKNTVAAIEEMPADKFGFKPTPDQMSFGHLAAHIAEANYFFCAKVGDVAAPR